MSLLRIRERIISAGPCKSCFGAESLSWRSRSARARSACGSVPGILGSLNEVHSLLWQKSDDVIRNYGSLLTQYADISLLDQPHNLVEQCLLWDDTITSERADNRRKQLKTLLPYRGRMCGCQRSRIVIKGHPSSNLGPPRPSVIALMQHRTVERKTEQLIIL